ncbi:LytS/YhcK type 5TM receptor domain-containing protein [Brevibacillus centrosporus]|uniref:histidine kinase n=1 Tax=Brevibacillus centrosporus TaxID=54910 RepID=A0A1I3TUH7_9BACL|nr:LytS/YhcK type 5TM receptor domain-containing protein [Brevibacillus centrosporus]MEC2132496.1 LytS/YhcK type 5TM receptor domain-containing protein [Brevibacillus centrosporus]MED4908595.1 LytS/YhcK type 5TM receptor domain-containing protein [Brevibacillus centrosporus]RNB69751.1 sensor histidine kinase [Brevibacillus centrosporus]SFJ74282.1 two-component system, LytT family, sensor histidine kinase LytS [Brevibacillus centrosporus]GED29676.1 sensor protein LytS [Brevibacillus centrosporu
MDNLTLLLIERMGILLTLAFILTRIPLFRQLLDREVHAGTSISYSLMFGLFGIAGTYAGVVIKEDSFSPAFWIFALSSEDVIANSTLVGVVIGGLLGGPLVGLGAGLIAGAHVYGMGGFAALPIGISIPVTGLLAGYVARFFSQERVISPSKALFIGMFAPVIQMSLMLIMAGPPDLVRTVVNVIGVPMVLTNSISIAIFTTMIRVALQEQERSAALEAERAFTIAERILPHLKMGLTPQTAQAAALLLQREVKAAAVAVTDREQLLAHVGAGAEHHLPGAEIVGDLDKRALFSGAIEKGLGREVLGCSVKNCTLQAAILVPIREGGSVVGLIKLYFRRPQQIGKVQEALAKGLSNLISNQLTVALTEKMKGLMKDAELRMLQAQIHPHFLFNTLNAIVTLIRIDPQLARHMTVQLGTFMRLTLKLTAAPLVSVKQELDHLLAYLEIIKVRFSEQFAVRCYIGEGVEDALIPPGTLQPLVENCIQHGLRHMPTGGEIALTVKKEGNLVCFHMEDNGCGVAPDLLPVLGRVPTESKEGNGIGVHNVNQRLVSLRGPDAQLNFCNKPEGGCLVTFSIPIQKEESA